MASTALGHASPEVRRRGCEHLAAHPGAAYARHLAPLLEDGSQGVVAAAIRALGAIDSLDDLRPLRQLLASSSEETQLEAGAALARFHDPAGMAALDRLTYSDDPRIRTHTAQVMGDLGEPSFAGALVRLLDDRRASVAHAALSGLPKVAGRDVAQAADESPPDTNERVRRWKQWLAAPRSSP
jgi:HEAT repeat protein